MKEKLIRDNACKWLEAKGCLCLKLELLRRRGMPDVLVLTPDGQVWFIEFKQPGKKPTALQWRTILRLREMGFEVSVHTSVLDVKREWGLNGDG